MGAPSALLTIYHEVMALESLLICIKVTYSEINVPFQLSRWYQCIETHDTYTWVLLHAVSTLL